MFNPSSNPIVLAPREPLSKVKRGMLFIVLCAITCCWGSDLYEWDQALAQSSFICAMFLRLAAFELLVRAACKLTVSYGLLYVEIVRFIRWSLLSLGVMTQLVVDMLRAPTSDQRYAAFLAWGSALSMIILMAACDLLVSMKISGKKYWGKSLVLMRSRLDGSLQAHAFRPLKPEVARVFEIKQFTAHRHMTVCAAPDVPVVDGNFLHLDMHFQLTPKGINAWLKNVADQKTHRFFKNWERFLTQTLYQQIANVVQATVANGPQDCVVNGYSRESALQRRQADIVRAVEAMGVRVERIRVIALNTRCQQETGTFKYYDNSDSLQRRSYAERVWEQAR